jgi:hypothetical protein
MFNVKEFDLTNGGSRSSHAIFRDEDIDVSVGFDSERHKLITVSFKKLAIEVITFDFVNFAIELGKDSTKKDEFITSILGLVKMDFYTLNKLVKASYDDGFKDGQYELKTTIRELLGVECTQ